ncbi:DNA polymerase III subunit delta' [Coriobacteriia bacterium Es71-Z0120]|uniref:DNA polymerase III subunit delta' n=1 Tax=Parvivirga hydrogeniphila TaxID=2939460 RepID=UPI002260A1A9|nr:DNA polymerase III subunit delta' [Parvivirga hydrogeniphila]MCL4079298.1 DNA polymerase III subunit delta' [Parvivirga hydrogeniphila]
MTSGCAWDRVALQRPIAKRLKAAVESGKVSHAYLFVGQPGSGTLLMAQALACAVLCESGGCGACPTCARVWNWSHPDLVRLEPQGSAGYTVEQARELVHDVGLRPVAGAKKVYVIEDADRLGASAANALLKTIEEPPPSALLVLLARSYESVLPTVASRCQVVRFAPVPEPTAVALLVERTGASPDQARAALAAAGGVLARAEALLRSPMLLATRVLAFDILKRLPYMDGHDVLLAARDLLAAVRAPLEDVKAAQAAEIAERREYFGTDASVKPLEERHRRELTARERESVALLLGSMASWVRDALAVGAGREDLAANADEADAIEEVARVMSPAAAVRAVRAVEAARERVSYNVNPQVAIEAMLFDLQEVLKCPR